jgi:hypothetical protein
MGAQSAAGVRARSLAVIVRAGLLGATSAWLRDFSLLVGTMTRRTRATRTALESTRATPISQSRPRAITTAARVKKNVALRNGRCHRTDEVATCQQVDVRESRGAVGEALRGGARQLGEAAACGTCAGRCRSSDGAAAGDRQCGRLVDAAARNARGIDLVQIESGPIGDLLGANRSRLDPWLGEPRRKLGLVERRCSTDSRPASRRFSRCA